MYNMYEKVCMYVLYYSIETLKFWASYVCRLGKF